MIYTGYVQFIYDLFIKSGLVIAEELDVFKNHGTTSSSFNPNSHDLGFIDDYQVNILIKNIPFNTIDVNKFKVLIIWFLNNYQADRYSDHPLLVFELEIKTSTTADVLFSFTVKEPVIFKKGKLSYPQCTNKQLEVLELFLDGIRDNKTGELIVDL